MIVTRSSWSQVASAFAIGLGAGAALGLLFAPQSGEDTRALLRNTAQDGVDEAVSRGKSAVRRARAGLDDTKEFVDDIADAAANAYHEARKAAS
jgi:gas vesicle protein